jgi:hypothetical protein
LKFDEFLAALGSKVQNGMIILDEREDRDEAGNLRGVVRQVVPVESFRAMFEPAIASASTTKKILSALKASDEKTDTGQAVSLGYTKFFEKWAEEGLF